jgi:hypothetical protein
MKTFFWLGILLVFSAVWANGLPIQPSGKLNPSLAEDKVVIDAMRGKLDKRFHSSSDVILKRETLYTIFPEAIRKSKGASEKNPTSEVIYSVLLYIQTDSGIEKNSFQHTYDSSNSSVAVLEGRRVKKNLSFDRVNEESIFDESLETDPRIINYQKQRIKKFTIENVQVGDVVEFKSREISWKKMGGSGFGISESFDTISPVLSDKKCFQGNSEIPIYFKTFDKFDSLKKEVTDLEGIRKTCFIRENEYAEFREPSTPNRIYDTPVVYVTTWGNWDPLAEWMGEKYEGKFEPDKKIIRLAKSIVKDLTGKEAVRELFHWMEKNVTYVQVYLNMDAGYVPTSAASVSERRFGDCKEKTTLFIALLKAIRVTAYPVIIGTNSIIDPKLEIPMLYQFNHMITYIEDYDLFIDPVGTDAPFPYLLSMDLDRSVFILKGSRLVKAKTPLVQSEKSSIFKTEHITLLPNQNDSLSWELIRKTKYERTGGFAATWHGRRKFSKDYLDYYMKNEILRSSVLISYQFENDLADFTKPVIFTVESRQRLSSTSRDATSNKQYLMLPPAISIDFSEDFYKFVDRKYPYTWVEYPFQKNSQIKISIPLGFEIVSIPQDIHYHDLNSVFTFDVSYLRKDSSTIFLDSTISYNKPVLEATEFRQMRETIAPLINKVENRILLVSNPGKEK